jgi:hypothetical protein
MPFLGLPAAHIGRLHTASSTQAEEQSQDAGALPERSPLTSLHFFLPRSSRAIGIIRSIDAPVYAVLQWQYGGMDTL